MDYQTYITKFNKLLHATYELGSFDEDMDFDVFCLETYNEYLACTL